MNDFVNDLKPRLYLIMYDFLFLFKVREIVYCVQCTQIVILKGREAVSSCFCLQIHALAGSTMNSKFSTLRLVHIENFSFIVRPAGACICKQNTHNSL